MAVDCSRFFGCLGLYVPSLVIVPSRVVFLVGFFVCVFHVLVAW